METETEKEAGGPSEAKRCSAIWKSSFAATWEFPKIGDTNIAP